MANTVKVDLNRSFELRTREGTFGPYGPGKDIEVPQFVADSLGLAPIQPALAAALNSEGRLNAEQLRTGTEPGGEALQLQGQNPAGGEASIGLGDGKEPDIKTKGAQADTPPAGTYSGEEQNKPTGHAYEAEGAVGANSVEEGDVESATAAATQGEETQPKGGKNSGKADSRFEQRIPGVDFGSDEAAELARDSGLTTADFDGVKPSGKTGYVQSDVRRIVESR